MIRYFYIIFAISISFIESSFADVGWAIVVPPGVITTTPAVLIAKIITYAIGVAAILGVIGITWGGIQMILSVWEDEKLKKWRYIVLYSIVWVIVAGLAYSLVNLVGNIKL